MEKKMNNPTLKTIEEAMAKTLYPVPGDIISGRYHYGIYIGHGQVIHLPVPTPEKPEPVFSLEYMSNFMGFKPIVVRRESEDSVNKPLPAGEIIGRAKSMLGKPLGGEIGCRKDFVNWCRYGVVAPDVQNITFETPEYLGTLICWNAAGDRHVESLGLSDIDAKGILTETRKNPPKPSSPESALLYKLFEDPPIDEIIEKTCIICLKELKEDGSYTISAFLVYKKNYSPNRTLMVWQTPVIREDLQEAFGNRNMCIIE